jgi:mannose-6-phosphate isomerase
LPFLLKYIHAAERLSVQVHPDDETAAKLEGTGPGKTEAWYILNAPAGARLIAGLRPKTTRDDLTAALNEGRLEDLLHEVEPQAGDTFYIHAGLVHSIGPDVGLFEIQQNIDLTYRFHDWNRTDDQGRPRPLHPEKALAALELNPEDIRPFGGLHFRCEDRRATALAAGRHFYLELAECHGPIGGVLDGDRFEIWTPLSGSARLLAAGTPDAGLTLEPGPAVLLPAALGEYALQPDGAFTYLRAFVPDLSAEVVQPLKHEGFSADEIVRLGGFGAKNDLKPLV